MRLPRFEEREEERVRRPAAPTPHAPQLARIIALQQSAGNQAVGRMLSRLTDDDVSDIRKDRSQKKIYEAAQKQWSEHFGISGPYKDGAHYEAWHVLVEAASSLSALVSNVDKLCKKAVEAASAKPEPEPEKTKQPEKEKEKEKEPETVSSTPTTAKKKQKFRKVDDSELGFKLGPISTPSPTVTATGPSPAIVTYTQGLNGWLPSQGHGGKNGTTLTLTQAQELVDWAQDKWSRSSAVFHARGDGSGTYAGQRQLKFIHKSVDDKPSGKKATYHITLKPTVLDALTGVEDL